MSCRFEINILKKRGGSKAVSFAKEQNNSIALLKKRSDRIFLQLSLSNLFPILFPVTARLQG